MSEDTAHGAPHRGGPFSVEAPPTRALVLHVDVKGRRGRASSATGSERSAQAKLEEATGLARAIDLEIAAELIAPISHITPATLIGPGKAQEIAFRVVDGGLATPAGRATVTIRRDGELVATLGVTPGVRVTYPEIGRAHV